MSFARRIASVLATLMLSLGLLVVVTPASNAAAAVAWPCSPTFASRACVDLSQNKAWLRYKGTTTVYGPVKISHGRPGYRTPTGTFRVTWKDKDHYSKEFNGPMPYSVFFTNNGHAFHYGSVEVLSHGCIHLTMTPAKKFYWHLSVGDVVQIKA